MIQVSNLAANFRAGRRAFSSTMKIYGFPLSQPTRSVLMLCKENKVPFEFQLVDPFKGENKKLEFKKMHPTGLLPAISVGENFVLGESAAIMQYICEEYQLNRWYPPTYKERAWVNFWLHWNHTNTRASTKKVLLTKLFPPKAGAEEAKAKGTKEYAKAVAFLEGHFDRTKSKYLVGDILSIADLAILPEVDQLSRLAFDLFDYEPYPLVTKWLLSCREELQSYQEVFDPVTKIALRMNPHKDVSR